MVSLRFSLCPKPTFSTFTSKELRSWRRSIAKAQRRRGGAGAAPTRLNSIQYKSSPVQPSRSGATNRRLLKKRSPKSANMLLQQLCVSLPPEGSRRGPSRRDEGGGPVDAEPRSRRRTARAGSTNPPPPSRVSRSGLGGLGALTSMVLANCTLHIAHCKLLNIANCKLPQMVDFERGWLACQFTHAAERKGVDDGNGKRSGLSSDRWSNRAVLGSRIRLSQGLGLPTATRKRPKGHPSSRTAVRSLCAVS